MATNLTHQVREIAEVTTAVAEGDLRKKIQRPAQGEILQLQLTINQMVDQLRTFATEVTRVARDVGTEGLLGGQAQVLGVKGMWDVMTVNGTNIVTTLHRANPVQASKPQLCTYTRTTLTLLTS